MATTRAALLALVMALLLAACAGPASRPVQPWVAQRDRLEALSHWTLEAKAALRTPRGAESARLHWQQSGSDSDLSLAGPFGAGAVAISRSGNRILYRDGEGRRELPADDPAAVAAAVGWPVPVDALPWWLRALPAPESRADVRFDEGRPSRIAQQGWVISYQRYATSDGLLLPEALTLRYPPAELELRIAAARWQPGRAP